MKQTFLYILLLAASASHAVLADTLSGHVLTTGGQPVVQAVVSDGYSVVQTDGEGRYEMNRHDSAQFVFLSVPEAYEMPVDENGSPLLYARIGRTFSPVSGQEVKKHTTEDVAPVKNATATSRRGSLRNVEAEYLFAKGMTPLSIAERLVKNDLDLYADITELNEGSPEQWADFIENCPDNFSYLVNDNDEIVGDWSIVALDEETYARAVNGETVESEFTLDSTEYICFPGEYNGYLLNMSLNMEYKTLENNLKLVDSFFARLESFAKNGIFFKRFCVNVFRRDQQAFYKNFGFTYKCDNRELGKLYEIELLPYPKSALFEKRDVLKKLYEDHNG